VEPNTPSVEKYICSSRTCPVTWVKKIA
jgi:hypothetical protein